MSTSSWKFAPLLPLSRLYQRIIQIRNLGYDRHWFRQSSLSATVISIGNLSVGGTGKTPTTAFLANALLRQGRRVAIVARGYRRKGRGPCIVSDGREILANVHDAGDEPLLLAGNCPCAPIVVDSDKTHAAKIAAHEFDPEIVLVDDGFQHRSLRRDLDVVLTPASLFLEKHWLLPAGPLREPLASLKRADFILISGMSGLSASRQARIRQACERIARARLMAIDFRPANLTHLHSGESIPLNRLRNAKAAMICGIAQPERFRRTLESLDCQICEELCFADHHRYDRQDAERLSRLAERSGVEYWVTTSKDAGKLREFARLQALPIYALEIELVAPRTFLPAILAAVDAIRPARVRNDET